VREDFSLTTTRNMVGTPLYMSPEQVKAPKVVDTRSDIWALGVVLFELLTGRAPFVAETIGEIFAAILQAPIPPARQVNPAVPEGLDAVLARCMERDIDRRFQTVQELSAALQPFASKETIRRIEVGESVRSLVITRTPPMSKHAQPVSAKPVELPFAHTVEKVALATLVSAKSPEERPRRGASSPALVAAVAAVVLVVAGGAWMRSRASATAPRVTSAPIVQEEGFAPLLPVAMPVTSSAAVSAGAGSALPIPAPRPAASSRPSTPRASATTAKAPPPGPATTAKKHDVDVLEGRD
jgi:serine/threonine-protein kinase